ncbi:pyridoxal phosphate-dependent aminotransferase [Permianibacter fluminis]|uniref:pyridoxal phosphate-dependent aminotransferase n=1 Tax=Permianibacter fluminis TaxID=2738515 RepID=UPI002E29D00B|nr:pyridoxal phosphate-dependent aminotransferase [Permianibacter fluminis]
MSAFEIRLSNRVQNVKPSPTLAVAARAAELKAQGRNIVGLGTGEPDFDTPEHIKEAAIAAIKRGDTKYTPVGGTPQLKDAIIEKFKRDNGLSYNRKQVLVSSGGKQSFFNLCQALLNPGDEVIIPAPYWVSYPDIVIIAEGVPVILNTTVEQHLKITAAQLERAITPKTRLVVLNSPSNPSGIAYSSTELRALAEVLLRHPHVMVATDDMYEHILWTEEKFHNILNVCPELYDRTIVLNGVSKAYAMTGWRIGYAAGPVNLMTAMDTVQSQSTSNPCSISQAASVAALNGDQSCMVPMVKAFKQRHDYLVAALNAIPGVSCLPSDGTFYAFPNVSGLIKALKLKTDLELAEHLINAHDLALVPGSAFGSEGHMRLSYATSMGVLEEAVKRLKAAAESAR